MNERLEKLLSTGFARKTDKFFNSVIYIAVVAVICMISHTFDLVILGAALLALLLFFALVFCKNSFVLMPFFLMCSFVLSYNTSGRSDYYTDGWKLAILGTLLVFVLAALVFHFVYYKKWKLVFKRAYLTVSLSLLSGAMFVGGFSSPTYCVQGLIQALAIAATMFLPYALFVNCGEYNGRKTAEYFMWTILAAALVISEAILAAYMRNDFDYKMAKSFLKFGYAVSNSAASYVLLAIPVTFYFIYIYKHGYILFAAVVFELFVIFLTSSRAALLVAIAGTAAVAIALCFKKKNGRLGYYIAFGIFAACIIAAIYILRYSIYDKLSAFMDGNFQDSGRIVLWKDGQRSWSEHKLFGLSFWYLRSKGHGYWSFHCEPLTYLFCTGIVGFCALLYHRYKLVRVTFSSKPSPERVFIALAVLAMLLNALLDVIMTDPAHLLYYSTMLALIECDAKYHAAKPKLIASAENIDPAPSEENNTYTVEGEV